jgi:uncharacterized membrane protein YkvA (DUF1232 family)
MNGKTSGKRHLHSLVRTRNSAPAVSMKMPEEHRERLLQITREFQRQLSIYRAAIRHPQTPRLARWLLVAAVAYAASPIDLIPDFIPVLGHLDDLIVIPALVALAVRLIPENVLIECRNLQLQPARGAPTGGSLPRSPSSALPGS